ncbi:MAG TPA: glycosyltransferase family 4 protein [Gemmatimonadaceae bacterium]|nr:glycosyltransferase family 4 protein [Gemmatimonadaceae bacterium]
MTRALFWTGSFWPHVDGTELLAARLIRALADRGYDVAVVTRRTTPECAGDDEVYVATPVHRFPFLRALRSGDVASWIALRQQVAALKQKFRPDVVHLFHLSADAVFHLDTRRAHPAPTLCTVHGALSPRMLGPHTTLAAAIRSSEWIAACSHASLQPVHRAMPRTAQRSSVVWSGLEPPPLAPTRIGATSEPRVLCIGRLNSPEQGFDLALGAFTSIAERYPRARLIIAGDGAIRPELVRLTYALQISTRVDFLGAVPPSDIPALIQQASVVMMPSRAEEGFPLVALQAAHMARPVVATRTGGVSEVVADGMTGLIVEREDAAGLARGVTSLLADSERANRMGSVARARALESFGWNRYVDAYDELYQRIARSARTAVPS